MDTLNTLEISHARNLLQQYFGTDAGTEQPTPTKGEVAAALVKLENAGLVAEFNRAVCWLHDVQAHLVRESCFASKAPADEQDLWFLSTSADSELCAIKVPLASTEDAAYALGMQHYQLRQRLTSLSA